MQPALKQSSPTQGNQVALTIKPGSADTNKSESSGTTESGKPMTRQRTHTKGKELKGVNEAEDPEAKARKLRALARQKKEKEQAQTGSSSSDSPAKIVTFNLGTSVTTPVGSPATKTSSSTPSDLSKSDSSDQKVQIPAGLVEADDGISELFPLKTPEDLDKVNEFLDGFLGGANKVKKKESTESREDSMEEHISSVAKKIKQHTKAHSSPERDNMKEPFGKVAKPVKTVNRILPNSKGGMSLKSVQDYENEEARSKLMESLQAEGIDVSKGNWNIFLPNETEMNKDSKTSGTKTTGMTEFAQDFYESGGVTDPGHDLTTPTVGTAQAELIAIHDSVALAAGNTFADDANQTTKVTGGGEWKTPKHKDKRTKNLCSQLSPYNLWKKGTGQASDSASASDSTVAPDSPNHNPYSPLSDDKEDDSKNPLLPPITDIESALSVNDQHVTGETPNALEDESEQKRDEEGNVITGNQEDPESQDFHKAGSE